ncbi:hypothetical protein HRH25_09585 [Flavisolibacter sp. BT320]|nr:hypothetical protein [Flavisolibacter longurius]
MKKLNKRIVYGISLLLMGKAAFAQNVLTDVQASLTTYVKAYTPEKLYLHTDKAYYTAGEILWMKVYAVDGVFNRPLPASKVAYVEILSEGNVPVAQAKIALAERGGDGSIQLPFTLNSGHYTLRAYTAWMKNAGVGHFFEKGISIINTLKSLEAQDETVIPASSLQLFPEGGNLVNGLPSRVAFRLAGNNGKGTEGNGFLLNEKADTLASFTPFQFGMGHFNLTPQKGSSYKVIFQLADGKTVSRELPGAYDYGYTLQVEEAGNDQLRLQVNAKGGNAEVFLLAQTRQQVKAAQRAITNNGQATFTIDKKALGEGVSQFTIFNAEKKPVCERLYFIPPAKQEFRLQAAKNSFGTREKVDLLLDSAGGNGNNLSLAVFQLDEWQSGEATNIDQYIWLTSELSGPVENPAYYFGAASEERKKTTDYLMMTQGWRRFRWEQAEKETVLPYQRERSGQRVTGRVTDTRTGAPAKDVQVFLSVPSSPYKLFTAISDSTGMVRFEVSGFYGAGEMIIQTSIPQNTNHKVEILSPFAETYRERGAYPLALNPAWQKALVNRSIGMQAQHIYHHENIRRFYPPLLKDTLPFYGQSIYSYDLDDYVRFNTLEEVLREYVREVNVGVKGSGESLRLKLFNDTERRLYQDDILVLVDGIPQLNPNKVFDLNPLKIKRLDIIPRNFVLGHINYQSMANFISYTGQYEGLVLDPQAITIDYEGLQLQREFYAPEYATEGQRNSRLPDLRTTLYWQPNVDSKLLSFYTGDNKGRFLAVLQGFDGQGRTISTSVPFEVK